MIALLNKAPSKVALASGACQTPGVLSFQPASKTEQIVAEIEPVAWFQRLGSFAIVGAFFSQTLRIRRLVSTLLTCSTREANCSTRFSPMNHATAEMAHAGFYNNRIYLCGGRSLCSVAIDLNGLKQEKRNGDGVVHQHANTTLLLPHSIKMRRPCGVAQNLPQSCSLESEDELALHLFSETASAFSKQATHLLGQASEKTSG